jgi:selenide,water dikinase
MERLNRAGAKVMAALDVRGGTDVTGFGLLGHAMQMADASGVTLHFDAVRVPLLPGALALAAEGCLPGGMFRNLDYVERLSDAGYEAAMIGDVVPRSDRAIEVR